MGLLGADATSLTMLSGYPECLVHPLRRFGPQVSILRSVFAYMAAFLDGLSCEVQDLLLNAGIEATEWF